MHADLMHPLYVSLPITFPHFQLQFHFQNHIKFSITFSRRIWVGPPRSRHRPMRRPIPDPPLLRLHRRHHLALPSLLPERVPLPLMDTPPPPDILRRRGMQPEPKDARHIPLLWLWRDQRRVHLQQHVRERRAKVGAVEARVAGRLGVVNVFALGAEELDGLDARDVRDADGEDGLVVAEGAGAVAKVAALELFGLEKNRV